MTNTIRDDSSRCRWVPEREETTNSRPDPTSERLADAEMHAPAARLGLTVHQQSGDWRQLVAVVEADRPDRGEIPQPEARIRPQRVELERARLGPGVAGVDEDDATQFSPDRKPHFG